MASLQIGGVESSVALPKNVASPALLVWSQRWLIFPDTRSHQVILKVLANAFTARGISSLLQTAAAPLEAGVPGSIFLGFLLIF
jgi:hypothetical protein